MAAVIAAAIFSSGAPTSVFLAQFGIFASLALALARPRFALQPLARHPYLSAALAFYFLVQLASIVYSQHPLRSLICLRGDWPVLYLPILLAVLQVPRARKTAWVAVLGAAALAGVVGLLQHFTGTDPLGKSILEADGSGRFHAIGSLKGHLTFGGVMLVGLVAAFTLLLTGRGRGRAVALVVVAACGLGLVMSYARSAFFGALIGVIAATLAALARSRRAAGGRAFILSAAVLVAAGCILAVALTPGLRSRLAELGGEGTSPRVRLWGTALAIFADFPLFGAGLGSFKSHFPLYRLPGDYMATGHPHNDALNVLVHSGLAGLLAWGALWWTTLRAATGGRMRGLAGLDPGVLAIAIVVAFLAAGLGQCYFTDEEPAAMLWLLLALAVSERDAAGATASTPASPERPPRRRLRPGNLERVVKRALLPMAAALLLPRDRRAAPALASAGGPGQRRRIARGDRPRVLAEAGRILVVRQDNRLGNLVLMTPFLQALRVAAPQARIGLLAGSRFADVVAGAPWFDELLLMRKRTLIRQPWSYPAHLASIRRGGWDVALDLSNPDTHSFYNAFVPVVARARWRVGFDHPQSRSALNAVVPPPERECHYSLAPLLLLSALGADPQPRPMRLSPALIERARAQRATGRGRVADAPIVLHPGGRGAKRWPAEGFAALVRALAARRASRVLVIGGGAERALMAQLARELDAVEVRPISDLEGLVVALDGARVFVGCDAGPLHVAAALEIPVVALFLSSHPLRYAPLGNRHRTIVLGARSRAWLGRAAPDHRSPATGIGESPAPAVAGSPAPGVARSTTPAVAGPRAPRPAPGSAAPLTLAPTPDLALSLAERRPELLLADDGLTLAAQVDLVLAQVDLVLARAELTAAGTDSPIEHGPAGAEDAPWAPTGGSEDGDWGTRGAGGRGRM